MVAVAADVLALAWKPAYDGLRQPVAHAAAPS